MSTHYFKFYYIYDDLLYKTFLSVSRLYKLQIITPVFYYHYLFMFLRILCTSMFKIYLYCLHKLYIVLYLIVVSREVCQYLEVVINLSGAYFIYSSALWKNIVKIFFFSMQFHNIIYIIKHFERK
jgi:hypothetical protein